MMKIKYMAAAVLAAVMLTSCGQTNNSTSEEKISTAAASTEETSAAAEASDQTTETASEAASNAPEAAVTAAEKDDEYSRLVQEYSSEKWVPMIYRILKDKPYETILRTDDVYIRVINMDSVGTPEAAVFNEDCTSFVVYTLDRKDNDKYYLAAYGRTYDGQPYMYKHGGLAFACVHPNSRAASDKVELRYYSSNENSNEHVHVHNHAVSHSGLCLDDMKIAEFDGLDGRNNADQWAAFGITVDMDEIKTPAFSSGWTLFAPNTEDTFKVESGNEAEITRALYDYHKKTATY